MNMENYTLVRRIPKISEYRSLCESVGWGQVMNFDAAIHGLQKSTAGVVVLNEESKAIGMGRIVGDGAIYFYIQDIVVAPEYQKNGIGTCILNALLEYIKNEAPEKSFIGLFSVPEAVDFYKKFTIEKRDLIGLFTVKEIIIADISKHLHSD